MEIQRQQLIRQWQHLKRKVNAWTFAKRIVVAVGVSGVVGFGYNHFFLSPLLSEIHKAEVETSSLESQNKEMQANIVSMITAQQKSMQAAEIKFESLKEQQVKLDGQIGVSLGTLQPVPKLLSALQATLEKQPGLKLVYVKKLEERPLLTASNASGSNSTPLLAQQNIEVNFQGNYQATINYLEQLKVAGLPIIWGDINYRVNNYPIANVLLHVSTVNFGAQQ